jgi:cathepsin L
MLTLLLALSASKLFTIHEERQFVSWMRSSSTYYTGEEYQLRLGTFMANARFVSECNSNKANLYRVGVNHLAALTPAEYKAMLGYRPISRTLTKTRLAPKQRTDPPASIDWRDKGAVNEIKNQGQCGSCWAFAAIQASESSYFLYANTLLSLSESNLVDCDVGSQGCDGGNMLDAYSWVIVRQDGKFNLESDYPYQASVGPCRFDASKGAGLIADFVVNEGSDEPGLLNLVGNFGPAAVAIDASLASFQLYSGGIYNDPACSSLHLDHGVGAIGYGSEDGVDYWIVRNSWGTTWGEAGYVRMIRNHGNACGIARSASVPLPTK